MRCLLFLVLLSLTATAWSGEVYEAPDPEPTPEETLVLEYINRSRQDPAAEGLRIAPAGGGRIPGMTGGVDLDMFRREMKALSPAPPLVFDLALVKIARRHCHYMILNDQMTHEETAGRPGFTGRSIGDRAKAGGYSFRALGENIFLKATDPWGSHRGFVIDWGPGGPGGMQAGRGHRTNIHADKFTTVGVGALPNNGRLCVTHFFSTPKKGDRCAGGVVYLDKNGNGFYDIGEGRGGIEIKAGAATVTTWKSGAYTLPVGAGKIKISAEYNGDTHSESFKSGKGNIKFDYAIPPALDFKKADELMAAVEKIPAGEKSETQLARRQKAILALLLESESLYLDAERKTKLETLTGEARTALEKARAETQALLDGKDMVLAKKEIVLIAKPYRSTPLRDYFEEAKRCISLRDKFLALAETKAKAGKITNRSRDRVLKAMDKDLEKYIKTHHWRTWVEALKSETKEL